MHFIIVTTSVSVHKNDVQSATDAVCRCHNLTIHAW